MPFQLPGSEVFHAGSHLQPSKRKGRGSLNPQLPRASNCKSLNPESPLGAARLRQEEEGGGDRDRIRGGGGKPSSVGLGGESRPRLLRFFGGAWGGGGFSVVREAWVFGISGRCLRTAFLPFRHYGIDAILNP